ncbi:hypothetical protein CC78DRAFT_578042 [Lojkania enalia]|uniref:Nephrocystin 3-like N-terminal domain-containing protein n=1 Tax=Lojkania enalia TaxID=147567 RepID=A0A9P4N5Y4_9PLEO|nr:hypothetical protein CC78DRAFT_578042 [Didymosphaeria enalia]
MTSNIKGDPGKAKTDILSYFFCQAMDSRINNATAILRDLLYMLVNQQPLLVSRIQKKHDHAGKALFKDTNTWIALSEIFIYILQDTSLKEWYRFSHVKWIASSHDWPDTEERLEMAGHKVRLYLELNTESVSTAVSKYLRHKVLQLAQTLVYQSLEEIRRWATPIKPKAFPPEPSLLYERMIQQICNSEYTDLCM